MQIITFAIPHHVLDAHLPMCLSHDVFNASFVAIDVIVWSQPPACTTSQKSWMNSDKLRWNSETTMQRSTLSRWVRDSALVWCRRITWFAIATQSDGVQRCVHRHWAFEWSEQHQKNSIDTSAVHLLMFWCVWLLLNVFTTCHRSRVPYVVATRSPSMQLI